MHIFSYNKYYIGGIILNNMDMSKLLAMLSKMDKKDLEQGLAKASEILKAQENNKNNKSNN